MKPFLDVSEKVFTAKELDDGQHIAYENMKVMDAFGRRQNSPETSDEGMHYEMW